MGQAVAGLSLSFSGGVSHKAFDRYLPEHPEIKTVGLCLDNDEAGRKASAGYKVQLEVLGYAVIDAPPQQGKDYNDWCQAEKVQQHDPTSKKKSQIER